MFLVPPGPPQNLRHIKLTQDHCILSWKPPSDDGGSKITNYHIKKREKKTGNWVSVTSVNGYEDTCKVPGLKIGLEYYFSVCAENKMGIGKAAETERPIVAKKDPSRFFFMSYILFVSLKNLCLIITFIFMIFFYSLFEIHLLLRRAFFINEFRKYII